MYVPKAWHNFFALSLSMLGLYIGHNLQATYDVILAVIVLQFGAAMGFWFVNYAHAIYLKYIYYVDHRSITDLNAVENVLRNPPAPNQIPAKTNMLPTYDPTTLHRNSQLLFAQDVDKIQFSKERHFAVTLLRMRDGGFPVDVREAKWVGTGHQQFGRKEYVEMLDRWKKRGILVRANNKRNSTYSVADWNAVMLIASGERLPVQPLLQ